MSEQKVISPLMMDRSEPIGNSLDSLGRRAIHTLNQNSLVPESFDSFFVAYPSAFTEIYTYKLDSVTVATVTITYTDATKADILSVVKS
jgi:hypothetical protein